MPRRSCTALLIVGAIALSFEAPCSPKSGETIQGPSAKRKTQGQEDSPAVLLPPMLPETLTLDVAQALAVRGNPSLKAAATRVESARWQVKQARAAYYPMIDVSASSSLVRLDANSHRTQSEVNYLLQSYSTSSAEDLLMLGLPAELPILPIPTSYVRFLINALAPKAKLERDFVDSTIGLSLRYQLFDGFARKFTYAATKFGAKESAAGYLEAKRLLLSAVATSYFAATLALEDINVAKADEEFNLRLLKEAKARYAAGAAAFSDQLNFEVRANAGRALLIQADHNHAGAMAGLAQLLGLPRGTFPENVRLASLDEEQPEKLEPPDEDALVGYALAHRPDLLRRSYAVNRTGATAKAWRGAYYPSVGLSATEAATARNGLGFSKGDFGGSVRLDVSYNIYSGGRRRARLKQAKTVHAEAEYELDGVEIAIRTEIRRALEQLVAAQEQIVLQRANAQLVQENRGLVEKAYNAGQTSLVHVNEAQRDLVGAQVQLALARVGLRHAWHNLKTATGETLEAYAE